MTRLATQPASAPNPARHPAGLRPGFRSWRITSLRPSSPTYATEAIVLGVSWRCTVRLKFSEYGTLVLGSTAYKNSGKYGPKLTFEGGFEGTGKGFGHTVPDAMSIKGLAKRGLPPQADAPVAVS